MHLKKSVLCMTVFLSTISAITNTSPGEDLDGAIEGYQRSLIKEETTGSNVVMIFKDGKRIYHKPVQSGLAGDKQIDEKTIFPVWSMSKPITTVAMLILHEEGFYYTICGHSRELYDGSTGFWVMAFMFSKIPVAKPQS